MEADDKNNDKNNKEIVPSDFGIVGGFPGDAALLEELEQCRQVLLRRQDQNPFPLDRLIQLLHKLPFAGRLAVVRQFLAKSPHRDVILEALFDYCFQNEKETENSNDGDGETEGKDSEAVADDEASASTEEEDDEFLLIASANPSKSSITTCSSGGTGATATATAVKPLNGHRFHIFQVVLVLIPVSGKAGVEISRRYLQTTSSTKYRAKVMIQIVECFSEKLFSNQELWEQYQISSASVQDAVVKACQRVVVGSSKSKKGRQGFLEQVHEQEADKRGDLLYWCGSLYVEEKFLNMSAAKNDTFLIRFKHWRNHGQAYLEFLEHKVLQEYCDGDKLKRGEWFGRFVDMMELKSVQSDHVVALRKLLQKYPACVVIRSKVSDKAMDYLKKLSAQGGSAKEDVEDFAPDFVQRYQLPSTVLTKLHRNVRLDWAIEAVETKNWRLFASLKDMVPCHKLPYKRVLDEVTMDQFWTCARDTDPFIDFFLHQRLLLSGPESSPGRESLLRCWVNLHLRYKPSELTPAQISKYKQMQSGGMWRAWLGKLFSGLGVSTIHHHPKEHDIVSSLTQFCKSGTDVVRELSKMVKMEWSFDAVRDMKWQQFAGLKEMVPRHKLPYETVLKTATIGQFYAHLTRIYDDDKEEEGEEDRKMKPFLEFFFHEELIFSAPASSPEQESILQSWVDLHLRCKPDNMTQPEHSKYGEVDILWKAWYESWGKMYARFNSHNARGSPFPELRQLCSSTSIVMAANTKRIQELAAFAQKVLEIAVRGYNEVRSNLPKETTSKPIEALLDLFPVHECVQRSWRDPQGTLQILEPMMKQVAHVTVQTILSVVGSSIQFDPTKQASHVTHQAVNSFRDTLLKVIRRWHLMSTEIADLVIELVMDVHERATKLSSSVQSGDFVVVSSSSAGMPGSGQKAFVFYDTASYTQSISACQDLSKELLRVSGQSKSRRLPAEQSQKLFSLLKAGIAQNPEDVTVYLEMCATYCTGELFEEEKPVIIGKARAHIKAVLKTNHRWKEQLASTAKQLQTLGLLEAVLFDSERETSEIPMNVVHSLLVEHASFSSEKLQQHLRDATFASGGEERAEGLIAWIRKACEASGPGRIANAFTFATGRLKNESGANRKAVFQWLEQNFVQSIVHPTLSVRESENTISSAMQLCSDILAVQQNDLNRLDSVARHICFPQLSYTILKMVLTFDPTKPCLKTRELWIRCAIRLKWELQTAAEGSDEMVLFQFPMGHERLASASWISREAFDFLYPLSEESSRKKVIALSNCIRLDEIIKDGFDPRNVFGPSQAVGMLVDSINAVWHEERGIHAILVDGHFYPNEKIAGAQSSRLLSLIKMCGTSWQEVDILAKAFDNIFNNLETAHKTHVNQAKLFLDSVLNMYGVPAQHSSPPLPTAFAASEYRLVEACDKILRLALHTSLKKASDTRSHFTDDVSEIHPADWWSDFFAKLDVSSIGNQVVYWLEKWQHLCPQQGKRVLAGSVMNDRIKAFVYEHCRGIEPDGWRSIKTKTTQIQRECNMASGLLNISTTALFLGPVLRVLCERRQDILAHFIESGSSSNWENPFFQPSEADSVEETIYDAIDDITLLSSNSSVSRWYAMFAIDRAKGRNSNLDSRVQAINDFMGTPSTQHLDVLAALQSELDDAVREALINQVFSLDSPWHILGHLLSQKAIEKNDQRVTSSLLGYVARHVHVDKVVRVVSLLVKSPRREKLTNQLHNGILRMLFEAATAEAMALLKTEWENRSMLQASSRDLIIEKCRDAVVLREKTVSWEASVLSEVATDDSFDTEVKFQLFAPCWEGEDGVGFLDISASDGVATDDMLDLF